VASVSFEAVGKVYRDGTRAVEHLDLNVDDGEFVVLVGPSGCGKTTALRMVAGLEEITEGEIRIGSRVVNRLGPRERDIAMVFQNYALYPHMDVYSNMAFGLRTRKVPKTEARTRVEQIAQVLGLQALLARKPGQLSGGQRQRVALGRAIVREPQAFLMDEPLSNLDAKLRVQMRAEISRIQRELDATTIYVTHDQIEAMTMGDRVAVMRGGVLQQVDPPQRLYERPANLFVASFIGSPSMNLLQATLERDEPGLVCAINDSQRLAVPEDVAAERPTLSGYIGRRIAIGIRPEAIEHADRLPESPPGRRLRGSVRLTEALGAAQLAHVEIEGRPVVHEEVLEGAAEDAVVVEEMRARERARRTTIVCSLDPSVTLETGSNLELAVDTRRLHFFDLQTGEAIDRR
jgi:multiple sugar transport system ATP-binding protein